MSVRMNASLYSDLVRLERGDYLTFHCQILSQSPQDVNRYFFGAYYPRWRGFYLEEVREVVGSLGRGELKHFPAFPFDVYLNVNGEPYLTSDFEVGHVLVLGGPQNQRDDDVKRFKITSVDTQHLKTHHSNFGLSTLAKQKQTFINSQGQRQSVEVSKEVVELLGQLRDAYILFVGGGVPEIGIKAMGRPFRQVGADGRRWMTREGVLQLVRDSRAFGNAPSSTSNHNTTSSSSATVVVESKLKIEEVANTIYDAFPEEPGKGIDYDVVMDYVRGEMSAERKEAVLNVFHALDYDKDGRLLILDLQSMFNAQEHPVVVADKIFTAEKLLKGFVSIWDDNSRKDGHGAIPLSEFLDYYNGVSAVMEKDEVFFGVLQTTWKLPSWSSTTIRSTGKIPF